MTTLIGFGTNYYSALGGATPVLLTHESPNDVLAVTADTATLVDDDDDEVIGVDCTATASVFLTRSGKVYQTGTMHGMIREGPSKIIIELPLKCVEIAAGRHFCVGRMEGGLAAVSWGAGHFGQLGHGPNVCSLEKPRIMEHLLPHNTGSPLKQVAAGSWHGLALVENGTCFAWGSNRRWQCGIKRSDGNKSTPPTLVYPHAIEASTRFTKLACGKSHSVGLSPEGHVYTWGASNHGQCGHHTRKATIAPPRLVESLQKVVVVDISAGDSHTLALSGGGRVFSWGSGLEGQLGLGPATPLSRPKLVGDLDFVSIAAGQEWKQSQQQQQQHLQQQSAAAESFSPSRSSKYLKPILYTASPPLASRQVIHPPPDMEIPFLPPLDSVAKINSVKAAGSYSMAISSSGHVYAWGYNDVAVLGLPQPPLEMLPFIEPSVTEKMSGRILQCQTFDSRHNVLLPRRIDALSHLTVKKVAGGPSHFWCLCEPRSTEDEAAIGRTLYEVQEERRQRGLQRLRQSLTASSSSSAPAPPKPQQKPEKVELSLEKTEVIVEIDEPLEEKKPQMDSEEEDDDDVTTNTSTPPTFTETARAAPPSPKVERKGSITTRLMRKLSKSSGSKKEDKKKGRARKVLNLAFCKSER